MNKLNLITLTCCLILSLNGLSQITVTCSGNVGINHNNPSYKLQINGDAKIQSGEGSPLIIDAAGYNSNTTIHPYVNYGGDLGVSGNYFYNVYSYKLNGTLVSEFSDENIKENIRSENDVLSKILQLRCVRYDLKKELYENVPDEKLKSKLEADGKNQIGFLAQELMEFYPELVLYDSTANQYSITYTRMVPLLVEAIKEQQATIEALNSKVQSFVDGNEGELKQASLLEENFSARLDQNIPNPFSNTTSIKCYVPEGSQSASIYIFDMQGAQKKQLLIAGSGTQTVKVDGYSLKPGMYMYSLIVDNKEIDTKRMILTD